MEEKVEFMLMGENVEGCTSPPACPAMWDSPCQAQFHNGQSTCEGVRTFNIISGNYGNIDLSGLLVSYAFNLPVPYPPPKPEGRKGLIYIDERANEEQAEALEKIFSVSCALMGPVISVKKAKIEFEKNLVNGGPAASFKIRIGDGKIHNLVTRPLLTKNGKSRYVNNYFGAHVNVGISEVNEFNDSSLPLSLWNAPDMTVFYSDFDINPQKLNWAPMEL